MNTLDSYYAPHKGRSLYIASEIAGLGGTVNTFRPVIQYKQFFPVQKRRNAIGYNLQSSFITGYGGVVAPPFERAYLGGENDLRGFDFRTVSPIAYLPSVQNVALQNPDGTAGHPDFVPANPNKPVIVSPNGTTCLANCWNIPIPFSQLVTPGGDFSLNGNLEYRYTIAGPVALAPFVDAGTVAILRRSELQINPTQYQNLLNQYFGCPVLTAAYGCNINDSTRGQSLNISQNLQPVPGTNWVPRMSTGLELQVMLPVINAPFRIYYAYNAMRLDSTAAPPIAITRGMFPYSPSTHCNEGAGNYLPYCLTKDSLGSSYTLREPQQDDPLYRTTTF